MNFYNDGNPPPYVVFYGIHNKTAYVIKTEKCEEMVSDFPTIHFRISKENKIGWPLQSDWIEASTIFFPRDNN